jgi:malonyl-CoA decarboxylase
VRGNRNRHIVVGVAFAEKGKLRMNSSFFGELLQSISERGRAFLRGERKAGSESYSETIIELCEHLLSRRGEASGVALATEILHRYRELTTGPRIAFFEALTERFGPDKTRVAAAIARWQATPDDGAAAELHASAEPLRQELFRRLNLAPGGTAALVRMREQLIDALDRREDLQPLDDDFVHLFSSWFNRGFLVLRRIDWSTPASILEKIIKYEAVHEIRDWNDLRRRIEPQDRRCFAFFHPALVDDPLIFVEVALEAEIPGAIAPILASGRQEFLDPQKAQVAVFYSISNCQRGLAGVSFGNFLIKQVVEEICRELPKLSTFVTLSPAPNFASWLTRELANEASPAISPADRAQLALLEQPLWWTDPLAFEPLKEPLTRAAAWYYLRGKNGRGLPVDAVARFHLGNGARLERINWLGDTSERAINQAHGMMVNYLYDLDEIEKNHEAYAEGRTVVASPNVQRLVKAPLELVPASK